MIRAPRLTLKQTTAPIAEPVSLAEAKAHLRVDASDENNYIDTLIATARAHCEAITLRQFMPAQWRLTLDDFPRGRGRSPAIEGCDIILPRSPVTLVGSIIYTDTNGANQVFDPTKYVVSTDDEPARISLVFGEVWPVTLDQLNAVRISYDAGYGPVGAGTTTESEFAALHTPQPIKQAILMLVAHLFENRETVLIGTVSKEIEFSVQSLLSPLTLQECW